MVSTSTLDMHGPFNHGCAIMRVIVVLLPSRHLSKLCLGLSGFRYISRHKLCIAIVHLDKNIVHVRVLACLRGTPFHVSFIELLRGDQLFRSRLIMTEDQSGIEQPLQSLDHFVALYPRVVIPSQPSVGMI